MARITIRFLLILAAMTLALSALPAAAHEGDDDIEVEDSGKRRGGSYVGDANSRWFHVGGGVGAINAYDGYTSPVGRFVLGGGGYTFGFYATGGLEVSGTDMIPVVVQGVGGIGVHIPIPVVHPMFGIKVGGGFARFPDGPTPAGTIGAQLGMIVRQYDGKVGFRVLIEPSVTNFPFQGVSSREVFVTLALVL
jgi:hypothetical protein